MNSKRPIDVGMSSSLIDLKAELLKKQAEAQSSRLKGGRGRVSKTKTKSEVLQATSVYAKTNKGVDKRSQRDFEKIQEEAKKIEQSKSILEAKARLYEKMTSEALDHDESEHPVLSRALVNFTQKAIDQIKETNDRVTSCQPAMRINNEIDDDDDEWTEFTDNFGRTRRCLKTELPKYLAMDEELLRPVNPGVSISKEAEQRLIEMKRQKWEKDQEEIEAKASVHYQDVLFDEVRTHGVGFYNFSKDELTRADQLRELKKVSEETEATRAKILKERSKKQSALKERLKKIKAKKRAKLGLPPKEDDDSESASESEDEPEIGPSPAPAAEESIDGPSDPKKANLQQQLPEEEQRMRAWDFGKTGVFGPKPDTFDELDAKWLKNRRADRVNEFAPPKSYDKR